MLVLVCVSDARARRLLERCVRERGHEPTSCPDVDATRAELSRTAPPLALMDPSALPAALPRPARPTGVPRTLVVAVAQEATGERCEAWLAAGADDVLVHRLDPAVVRARLQAAEEAVRRADAADAAVRALEGRARCSEALAELGRSALRGLEPRALFEAAATAVRDALHLDLVEVAETTADGTGLVMRAVAGWPRGIVGRARLSGAADAQAGFALRSGSPVVVGDGADGRPFRAEGVLDERGVQSGVVVPLGAPRHPFGVLGAHTLRPRAFAPEEVLFLRTVADVLGAAVARAASQERMRRGEERSRLVLEGALDAVVAMDGAERVTFWNARAERIFGVARTEALGRRLSDLVIPARERPAHRAGLAHFLATGQGPLLDRLVEVRALRGDGTEFPAELAVTPVRTAKGVAFYAFVRDVSARVEQEEARRLLEERVRESEKAESLGILAGGIAHDFNNLLTSVIGNTELASLRVAPGSAARLHLARVEGAARRAADLTQQMLAYAGKSRLARERVDLVALVEERVALLEGAFPRRVRIAVRAAESVPIVEGDATQLRQVVVSLVTNGAEACGEGTGEVTVFTGRTVVEPGAPASAGSGDAVPPGAYALLEVSDTGCGMDAETRGRIFDPFFTTKRPGRGLGLAAVLGIVRAHGGAIRVHSEPGLGSAFQVLLPAREAVRAVAPASPERPATAPTRGTALLVDDEAEVRHASAAMLETLGFESIEAADGPEAIRIFREDPDRVELVLLDLTMPGMDGAATLDALREIRPDVRVVLSSGYAPDVVGERFPEGREPTALLPKPYTIDDLRRTLRRVIGGP